MPAAALRRVVLALALLTAPAVASAQTTYPPITSRDYAIDLYEQATIGSPRLVSMAGAINAIGEGAAGLYSNPASAAIRPETKAENTAFSWYLNSYIPTSGLDFNNNGNPTTAYRQSTIGSAGLVLQFGPWGVSANVGYIAHEIAPQAGGGLGVRSIIPHVVVARTFHSEAITVGLGIRSGVLDVYTLEQDRQLFTRLGATGELGAVWRPAALNIRIGALGALPVYTGSLSTECNPLDCYGYILPNQSVVPWQAAVGTAWRWGPTLWNQKVEGQWRDERALIVALDLLVIGSISNAYSMEQFAEKQLQPSGRQTDLSPRLGAEVEAIPGWLRVRGGTYYEPARYPGVDGRVHATGGLQIRLFAFKLGKREQRIALSGAGDWAPRYRNVGVSLGLWD